MYNCYRLLSKHREIFPTIGSYTAIQLGAQFGADFDDVPTQLINLLKLHKYVPQTIVIHVGSSTLQNTSVKRAIRGGKCMIKYVQKILHNAQKCKRIFAGVFVSLLLHGMKSSSDEVCAVNSSLTTYARNLRMHEINHKNFRCEFETYTNNVVSTKTYLLMLQNFDSAVEKCIFSLQLPGPHSTQCRNVASKIKWRPL